MDNNLQSITRIVDYIEAHFNLSWKSLYSRAMKHSNRLLLPLRHYLSAVRKH